MNFHIGQEVICVKSHSGKTSNGRIVQPLYSRGKKYIVDGVKKCKCGLVHLMLTTVVSESGSTACFSCKRDLGETWVNAKNFAPIDNTLSETTVEELLNEPQPC